MENSGDADTTDFQQAFSLTSQVLNTVTVPMVCSCVVCAASMCLTDLPLCIQGFQYGTDTGEASGEGDNADHTMFGIVRDHKNPAIYWRDSRNPTFRRLRLEDIDFQSKQQQMLTLETGNYFIDMSDKMVPLSL